MNTLPLTLILKGQITVIIGGGKVAARRVSSLLELSTRLIVISPEACPKIRALHEEKKLEWRQKRFEPLDLNDAFMVIGATNDPEVNREVAASAHDHTLVNIVDQPDLGNIHFPAHFTRGKLSIAISTHGASPLLAKDIKKELSEIYDERYSQFLDFLDDSRELIKSASLSKEEKWDYLSQCIDKRFLDPRKQTQTLIELRDLVKKGAVKDERTHG
ncbi:precorrin-2 dehydrogenase/sirohydrochlorin ferrochelatase [Pullulanibacillus pueri]|uniref:precorrin-2 dehydrogenase n=1 Tax=Pullulanibacillus pueri TaxID=1437324 RepID=A0A8J2ZZK2_9BACL|nr:NAD(P)-binding protein [Pullulanibacillus pueri]MBM7684039.1 precorrin-2 dehydrogenase/sirohydrochlorin ferrochelatase [Pullulanibacillus pueri]GGH88486.1 precorrin-2 dehydrogenase [Pullulanibacillus pueri]